MEYKLTLNRCHKVIERLKAKRNQIRAELVELSTPVSTMVSSGTKSYELDNISSDIKISDCLTLAQAISVAIASIKTKVADTNASIGLNKYLAEVEGYAAMKSLIDIVGQTLNPPKSKYDYRKTDETSIISVEQAKNILEGQQKGSDTNTYQLKINRISQDVLKHLKDVREDYQSLSYNCLDTASDLNKELIVVDIPDAVFPFTGLTK